VPDIPQEALQAAVEALQAVDDAPGAYGTLADFQRVVAKVALEAAAPAIAAQAVAEERRAVAAYLRRAHKGHGLMKLETFGRKLATTVEAGYHIEPECSCETLCYHCYASGWPCERHRREVGGV
jgi:sulfite reductase beta subunit-like hemoprotein